MDRSELRGPGDYGYDMAHEETGRGRVPDDADRREHPGPSPRRRDTDRGEDLAYDEAHDF